MPLRLRTLTFLACLFVLTASLQAEGDLTWAVSSGNLPKAEKYLAKGADINEVDGKGWTPLMWAIQNMKDDSVAFLLDKGANPNLQSTKAKGKLAKGTTALHLASFLNRRGAVTKLLAAKAHLDLADAAGMTPLHVAALTEHQEIVIELFHAGAKADLTDAAGKKAIDYAMASPLYYATGLLWKASKLPATTHYFTDDVECSPLGKNFTRIIFENRKNPKRTGTKELVVNSDFEDRFSKVLWDSKFFESVGTTSNATAMDASTLLVTTEIEDYFIANVARTQPLAGAVFSWMRVKVILREGDSGKVLREQVLFAKNSGWRAQWEDDPTHFASDEQIPAETGSYAASYVMIVAKP